MKREVAVTPSVVVVYSSKSKKPAGPIVSHKQALLTLFQVFKECIQHEALHPSRQVSQEMPWISACQAPSYPCPRDPAVHHLGNTSLGLCRFLWQVTAEGNATPW